MRRFTFIFSILLLVSCTKEEVTPRSYPRVHTLGVFQVTKNGMDLSGEIFYTPSPVTDHGFVWADGGFPTISTSSKLSLGSKDGIGSFEASAITTLETGKTYSVRAYAKSSEYTVYGEIIKFVAP